MKNKYILSCEENIFLAKKLLVENIYTLAKIEGLNVTFPQTQTILQGINVSDVRIDDIECILNLRNAWKYALANVDAKFDLDFVCKINNEVARNESLAWGVLRTGQVGIGGTDFKPQVPERQNVQAEIDKVLKLEATESAIEYFLYATRSQLFWDGNKRTSIICANKIMIAAGAGIFMIKDNLQTKFGTLLSEYYTTNNKIAIKNFLYNNCIFGIDY